MYKNDESVLRRHRERYLKTKKTDGEYMNTMQLLSRKALSEKRKRALGTDEMSHEFI